MPHYKCVTCTTRTMASGGPPGRCEVCGSTLEPVGELVEIVGYRLVEPPGDESFERAVSMALQGLVDPAGSGRRGDGSRR
jgi:hypothetical protein